MLEVRKGTQMSDAEHRQSECCDECSSDYFAATSQMAKLCPECAHWLYGYPKCTHDFVQGRCVACGWDGSVSAYLLVLQAQQVAQGLGESETAAGGGA